MRRSLAALIAATLLVGLVAGPAAAVPPKKVPKPSLVTTACVSADLTQMTVRSDWANQAFDLTATILSVTWTFDGKGQPTSPTTSNFVGPFDDPSFAQATLNTFRGTTGPVEWSSWSTIGTSTSGVFTDTAKKIRQPKGGWPTCV